MGREYYSRRANSQINRGFDLQDLIKLILSEYKKYRLKNYFQEYFGYSCVDRDFVPGRFGLDNSIKTKVIIMLKKDLWPFEDYLESCNQDEVFDIIEFLFDHVSAPIEERGFFHSYMECGWHFNDVNNDFSKTVGQNEFRTDMNELLQNFSTGYQLTNAGEIVDLADKGLEVLLEKEVPFTNKDLNARVDHAINLFRNRHSSLAQRLDALKNLADILEPLRHTAKKVLTNDDEKDLFSIINNFGIRHNNENQKTGYDKSIFFSWMFYYYLASIHACQRLINRKNENL